MSERNTKRGALLWVILGVVACNGAKGAAADKALYGRGLRAAERGAYEQALLLRARLSAGSSYQKRAAGEPSYLHAAKVYRLRAQSRIEALMGTGQCAAARQALRGALHLLRHWRTMEQRLRDCRPTTARAPASVPPSVGLPAGERLAKQVLEAYVDEDYKRAFTLGERYLADSKGSKNERILTVVAASGCKLGRNELAGKIRPRLSLPRLAILERACAKPADTLSAITGNPKVDPGLDSQAVQQLGSQAVQAYLGNNWARALTLGQRYLRRFPGDQKVLAIVGAAACKRGRADVATAVYRRLQPARRGMLRQVCQSNKIMLPRTSER